MKFSRTNGAQAARLEQRGCTRQPLEERSQVEAPVEEPHVTGGGAASAKHPSFLAVNTALGNIKTSLSGTYHAFGFRKYAHRYLAQVQYLSSCSIMTSMSLCLSSHAVG